VNSAGRTFYCRCTFGFVRGQGRINKETLEDGSQLRFIEPGDELILVLIANILHNSGLSLAFLGDIRPNDSFFASIKKFTGDEGIVAMVFNPLIGGIMTTSESNKKMAVYSDGDQSVATAKIVLDAIFYPQFAIPSTLAQNPCTLTPILADLT
jgi:hypothetical protein